MIALIFALECPKIVMNSFGLGVIFGAIMAAVFWVLFRK